MKSIYPKLALFVSINYCALTNTVFFPISCKGKGMVPFRIGLAYQQLFVCKNIYFNCFLCVKITDEFNTRANLKCINCNIRVISCKAKQ